MEVTSACLLGPRSRRGFHQTPNAGSDGTYLEGKGITRWTPSSAEAMQEFKSVVERRVISLASEEQVMVRVAEAIGHTTKPT